jgi:MerR family transcriptional regulator/heat shock protein HspR
LPHVWSAVKKAMSRLFTRRRSAWEGLVRPQRVGKNRLYSERDIERLRRIQNLTQQMGVNLAGVQIILDLLERMDLLQQELDELKKEDKARNGQ